MTNEELYQLMKDGFNQLNQRLDGLDTRLRIVENGISELKGKQSACAAYLHCCCYFQINTKTPCRKSEYHSLYFSLNHLIQLNAYSAWGTSRDCFYGNKIRR